MNLLGKARKQECIALQSNLQFNEANPIGPKGFAISKESKWLEPLKNMDSCKQV